MRQHLVAALALGLVVAGIGRADDAREARAIVEKAIKAMGRDKVAAFKAATWKGKGKVRILDQEIEFGGTWFVQAPTQQRADIEIDIMGMKIKQSRVLNGDKGWVTTNDMLQDMNQETLAETKHELYAGGVAQLLVLRDPAFQLSLLGDSKVGDRAAVGVKVSRKDQRDISLFFDKDTHFLLKSEMRGKDVEAGGIEFTSESYFLDYHDTNGTQRFRKLEVKRDGKPFVDIEVSDFEWKDKLDDSTFDKP